MIQYLIQISIECATEDDELQHHQVMLNVGVSLNKAYEMFRVIGQANRYNEGVEYIRLVYMPEKDAMHVLSFISKGSEW